MAAQRYHHHSSWAPAPPGGPIDRIGRASCPRVFGSRIRGSRWRDFSFRARAPVESRRIGHALVECAHGDIVHQPDIEAIVNAANAELRPGAGVAGAIHRAAGPGLYEECRPLGPIGPGDAVITGAHGLRNRYIIHCLGPVYGVDQPSDQLLAACYRNALRLAHYRRIRSVAFPAISTGVFGYPKEEAAKIAVSTVLEELPRRPAVEHVRFVLFDEESYRVYQRLLDEL